MTTFTADPLGSEHRGPETLMIGSEASDHLSYWPAENHYGFEVWQSHTLYGRGGDDQLEAGWATEYPPDSVIATLYGEAGDDHLNAGLTVDRLYGGADDDYIEGYTYAEPTRDLYDGGPGNDTIEITDNYAVFARCVGGPGSDTFLFIDLDLSYIDRPVKISDFETGIDKVVIAFQPGTEVPFDIVYRTGKGKLFAKETSGEKGDEGYYAQKTVIAKLPKMTKLNVDSDVVIDL